MKKVLVIHPQDPTTDMLKSIYEGRGWTVNNNNYLNKSTLISLIKDHDRIIMLGHGNPYGLFGSRGYIIDDTIAQYLRDKETFSVWCHSDQYFAVHNLKGFHTGNIISEVGEAMFWLGFSPFTEEEMWNNMVLFAEGIRDSIDKSPEEVRKYLLKHYVRDDAVTQYNRKNLTVL